MGGKGGGTHFSRSDAAAFRFSYILSCSCLAVADSNGYVIRVPKHESS